MSRVSKFAVAAIAAALVLPLVGCTAGPEGSAGVDGAVGATGATGQVGPAGPAGAIGQQGPTGLTGPAGPTGPRGANGPAGATGAPGVAGPIGSGDAALFFALMPGDNAATVASGADVAFPQDGPTTSTGTVRASVSAFVLADVGVYRITFQVPVTEPGQLVLTRNGVELPYTVTGRATGTSSIG